MRTSYRILPRGGAKLLRAGRSAMKATGRASKALGVAAKAKAVAKASDSMKRADRAASGKVGETGRRASDLARRSVRGKNRPNGQFRGKQPPPPAEE
jgi:hypothetical protein